MKNVTIESLLLTRRCYGADVGKMSGTLKVKGPRGEMSIVIDNTRALRLLECVADLLVETARDTAHIIASDVLEAARIEQVEQITEDKKEETHGREPGEPSEAGF